jgi:regulator of protease activity HflC (stomatin/prohibitin superfamily)
MSPSTIIKSAIAGVSLIALLSIGACSMESVGTGQRGVVVNFGNPTSTLNEGLHFINPFTTDIIPMNVRTVPWESETAAYTEDVQQANINFNVTFHLNPEAALDTYQRYGTNWANDQVPQVVYDAIKNVFGQSEAVADVIQARATVQTSIREQITLRLAERGVVVDGFELTNISFTEEFENANEQKQIAVELANAAENRTRQIEEEARQTEIRATAQANSMRIRAQALASNPGLTAYEAVRRWNGILCPVNSTCVYGENQTPFLNLGR